MNLFCACAIWRLCIVLNGWVSISNYVKVQTPKYLTFSLVVVKPLLPPLDRPWSIKVIQVEHPYPSRRFPPFKRCIARQAWTISQWAGNKRLHYLRKKRLIAWFPVLEKRHDSHPGLHYCPALLLHGTYRYHISLESNLDRFLIPKIPKMDLWSSQIVESDGTLGISKTKNVPIFYNYL